MRLLLALLIASPLLAETLVPSSYAGSIIHPGVPFGLTVDVSNRMAVEAREVVVTVRIDGVTGWRELPASCAEQGTRVSCAIGNLGARGWVRLRLQAVAPDDPSGRTLTIETIATDRDGNSGRHSVTVQTYRVFHVTTTAGSGPGSLHDALSAAREVCAFDCIVQFRIAGATTPWVTIRPTLPLPPMRGLILDGRSQTQAFGDTNSDGPEVEINGELAGEGVTGLVADSSLIYGLAITGFGGPGIHATGGTQIEGNVIGGNERGIVVESPTPWNFRITDNVISGNRRAGIFAWSGTNLRIDTNRIERNGASGIFMGPGIDGAYITYNTVAFNAHAGVSVAAGLHEVEIRSNVLHANANLGIDYLLDGVSRSVQGTSSTIDYPEITKAWYDPATDTTVVEGFQRAPRDGFTTRSVALYANDAPDPSGFGEGQYPLRAVQFADFRGPADPPFRITLKGRPPGRWITATVTVTWHYYWSRNPRAEGNEQGFRTTTSEFGPAVEIQGY